MGIVILLSAALGCSVVYIAVDLFMESERSATS